MIASDGPVDRASARQVLAHGYEIGVVAPRRVHARTSGVPAGWVVPLAPGLTPRDAMSIGTAGFTAAMSVVALEERGLTPADGPVLVTGASGGVGGTALAILAERGYEVWAATGKPDEAARLTGAGCRRDPDTGRGDRRGQAARIGALGRGRGRGRRGDAALRAADAPHRRGRRVQRQRRRPGARDDGLPVHPARRGAARDGLGEHADRAPALDSGTASRRTSGRATSACTARRSPSTRSTPALDAIVAGAGPRPLDRAGRRLAG